MNLNEFANRLLSILGLDIEDVICTAETGLFDEWALDSLQAFQMIVAIEGIAGAVVPPPRIPEMMTVGDAYDYYVSLCTDAIARGQSPIN